ncbi:MAG: hypothetical protein M0Z87_04080 [Actinomycetota bacterium]|nr:hypothetical protein [Actinomycetota bacterium]
MTSLVALAVLPGASGWDSSAFASTAGSVRISPTSEEIAGVAAALLGWTEAHLPPEVEPSWPERHEVAALASRLLGSLSPSGEHGASGEHAAAHPDTGPGPEGSALALVSPWNAVLLPMLLSLSPPPAVLLYWTPANRAATSIARSSGIGRAHALATWEHWVRTALSTLQGGRVLVLEEAPGSSERIGAAIGLLQGSDRQDPPAAGTNTDHPESEPPLEVEESLDPSLAALEGRLRSLSGLHPDFPDMELPPPSTWGGELLAAHRMAARHAEDAAGAWLRCARATEDAEACSRALEWAGRSLAEALDTTTEA